MSARFVWNSEDQTLIIHAAHFNGQSPTAPIRADNWLKSAPEAPLTDGPRKGFLIPSRYLFAFGSDASS